jgi:hypothetical protein
MPYNCDFKLRLLKFYLIADLPQKSFEAEARPHALSLIAGLVSCQVVTSFAKPLTTVFDSMRKPQKK